MLGSELNCSWPVVARRLVPVVADPPAHRRRTAAKLDGNGTDVAPGLKQIWDGETVPSTTEGAHGEIEVYFLMSLAFITAV